MKICTKCNQEKPVACFGVAVKATGRLRTWCKPCCATHALAHYHIDPKKHIERVSKWKQDNQARINESSRHWRRSETGAVSNMLTAAKRRATQNGLPFLLTAADIRIPEFCPVFGERLVHNTKKGPSPWSPSLDKIEPAKGYIPGNIRVLSHKANLMKNDATAKELLAFANWIKQTIVP